MDQTVVLGVAMFTGVVMSLVALILFARSRLVSAGDVRILINDDPSKTVTVPSGGKLLQTLASKGIFLASACGGGGSCAVGSKHVGTIPAIHVANAMKREVRL